MQPRTAIDSNATEDKGKDSGQDHLAELLRCYRAHDLEAARAHGQALLAELEMHADAAGSTRALRTLLLLARAARRQFLNDDALRFAHQGLARALAAGHKTYQCCFHGQLARTLKDLGQGEDAAREAEAAMRLATATGDAQALAFALEAVGSIHWLGDEADEGLPVFQRLEAAATACGDLDLHFFALLGQAAMLGVLANRAFSDGRDAEALAHCEQALERHVLGGAAARRLNDRFLIAGNALNHATTLLVAKRFDEARALYEQFLTQPDLGHVHAEAHMYLGMLDLKAGRPHEAAARLSRVVDNPLIAARPHTLQMALADLVDAHEAAGDLTSALATMRRFHALHVSNAAEGAQMRMRALAVQFETDKAKALAAMQQERAERLAVRNEELSRVSLEDALTGIANRRRFDEALYASPKSLIVALLDIDHFKQVNDRFSHPIGDAVLRRVADILKASCRRADLPARYGGEEFALLIDSDDLGGATALCERIRAAVQAEPWGTVARGLAVTLSIGLAHRSETPSGVDQLVELADQRLYAAKRDGRNRVVSTGSLASGPA